MTKILVVDDAAFMRLSIRTALESEGYEIVGEASTGLEAVSAFRQFRPDVITMDITMPGMDGVSAVRKIREIDPKAIIIICSALGKNALVIDAMKAGARDFIVKPFQAERLIQAIANQVES